MTIFIHVGQMKTGTSALQSYLAMNAALLQEFGIFYPEDRSFSQASAGKVTSGNIIAFRNFGKFEGSKNYLFSNEKLLYEILRETDDFKKILTIRENVKIIVFTRNLFPHIISQWGQEIKRGGYTKGIDEWALHHNFYDLVAALIRKLEALGISFSVRNYSPNKSDIIGALLDELVPKYTAEIKSRSKFSDAPVNRSLTLAEYELQRLFNEHMPGIKTSGFISDRLVDDLPQVPSQKPAMKLDVVEKVKAKNSNLAAFINEHLPEDEKVSLEYEYDVATSIKGHWEFSAEQLSVIVRGVAEKMVALEGAALKDTDANVLRDVAVQSESGQVVTRQQAIELMTLAAKARPKGPFIQNKLNEWKTGSLG